MMTFESNHRRRFMRQAAAWAAVAVASLGPVGRVMAASPQFMNDPFQLGVASGDPVADGFVIWSRLAPDPYDPKALPDEAIVVAWEVATDSKFKKVVARIQVTQHKSQKNLPRNPHNKLSC